jgi:hypothetical protein
MSSFFIYGSCVTRDTFTPGRSEISLAGYVARYSIARLPFPKAAPLDLSAIPSDFQRRMVATDLANGLEHALTAAQFDFLLIDFIDDRLGLVELPPGMATRSNELIACRHVPADAKIIKHGLGLFLVHWTEGAKLLARMVEERALQGRIVVNRVLWAQSLSDGRHVSAALPYMSEAFISERNAVLTEQYRIFSELLDAEFLDYPDECMVGDPNHKWGISPFHYIPAFYERQYEQLKALM